MTFETELLATYFEKFVRHRFHDLGRINARHPFLAILFVCIVSSVCISGLYRFQSQNENDVEDLWAPKYSTAQDDRSRFRSTFGHEWDTVKAIIEPVDTSVNILQHPYIVTLFASEQSVRSTRTSGKSYENFCQRRYKHPRDLNPCFVRSLMEIWNNTIEAVPREQDAILRDVNKGVPSLVIDSVLGGITRNQNGSIVHARAFLTTFYLDPNLDSSSWQEAALNVLQSLSSQLKKESGMQIWKLASISSSNEVSRASEDVTFLAGMSVLLCGAYLSISLSKSDIVKSNISLAMSGIGIIVLAYFSGLGLSVWIGLKYTPISILTTFLLLGVGIGNYILLIESWNFTDSALSIENRNSNAMMNAGIIITLTNWCIIIAFVVCSNSAFLAVFHFSLSTAIVLFFNFLYTITGFNAFMALSFQRMKAGRIDCFPCYLSNRPFHMDFGDDFLQQDLDAATHVARFYMAPLVVQVPFKILTVVSTLTLLCLSIYGTTRLTEEIDLRDVVPDNSYTTMFFERIQYYFPNNGAALFTVMGSMEYHTIGTKADMRLFQQELRDQHHVASTEVVSVWNYYDDWLRQKGFNMDFRNEQDYLRHLRVFFIDKSLGDYGHFEHDVILQEDGNGNYVSVVASRMQTSHRSNLVFASDITEAVDETRKLCSNFQQDLQGIYIYAEEYVIWDSFRIVTKELFLNMLITFLTSFCLLLAVLHPAIAIIVIFLTAAVALVVLSWLPLCGLELNSISVVCVIISVGLAAAYSSYVAYAFQSNKGNRNLRATMAVEMMGRPVLSAAFATFLGVVLLVAADAEIYRLFFKTLAGVLVATLLNGLLTLPVVLSVLGPRHAQETDTMNAHEYEREILLEDRDYSAESVLA